MIFIFSILLWGVAGVTYVLGAEGDFVPLVGIPGLKTGTTPSLTGYLNALYIASISIAAFLAVIKIIFAGVKYMLTDVVTTKGDAKKDIKGALLGLLIVIGAVLILNTINPNLTYLDVLKLDQVDINSRVVTQTGDSTTGEVLERAINNLKCASDETIVINNDKIASCVPITSANSFFSISEGAPVDFNNLLINSVSELAITQNSPQLQDIPREDIVGYLESQWFSPEGFELLSPYDNDQIRYKNEVLIPACTSKGGNKIIEVESGGYTMTTSYYCVK